VITLAYEDLHAELTEYGFTEFGPRRDDRYYIPRKEWLEKFLGWLRRHRKKYCPENCDCEDIMFHVVASAGAALERNKKASAGNPVCCAVWESATEFGDFMGEQFQGRHASCIVRLREGWFVVDGGACAACPLDELGLGLRPVFVWL
jgi:hypothetical protein